MPPLNRPARGPHEGGVIALDVFRKIFCKVNVNGVLGTRCDECPFYVDERCLTKEFKEKYWPDYVNFGPFKI